MAGTLKIPLTVGKTADDQKRIGTVRVHASEGQADMLHLGVLMPNYDIEPNGRRVISSYTLVPRTDVLNQKLLKSIVDMEMRSEKYHDDRRNQPDGDTRPNADRTDEQSPTS